MLTDIRDMQAYVVKWADGLMPDRLPEFAFKKLLEEIQEWSERPADGHEAADVFILFLDVCHLVGIDIPKALHYKMRINEQREWEIDERGLMSHVKNTRHPESTEHKALDDNQDDEGPITSGTHLQCSNDCESNCKKGEVTGRIHNKVCPRTRLGRDSDRRYTVPNETPRIPLGVGFEVARVQRKEPTKE